MRCLIVFDNLGFGFHWHLDLVNLCVVLDTFKCFQCLELVYNWWCGIWLYKVVSLVHFKLVWFGKQILLPDFFISCSGCVGLLFQLQAYKCNVTIAVVTMPSWSWAVILTPKQKLIYNCWLNPRYTELD